MPKTYVTLPGDTFSSISRAETGSERNAQLIKQANPGVSIPLQPFTTLTIPGGDKNKNFKPFGLDVKIDGTSVAVTNTFTHTSAVDGFSRLQIVLPNEKRFRDMVPMLEPTAIDAGYNGQQLFSGYVESPEPQKDEKSKWLNINASSWPNIIASPAPSSIFPFEMENAKLDLIARNLVDPFMVDVVFDGDAGAKFRKLNLKQSELVSDVLSRLCLQRAKVMRDNEEGALVFGNATGQDEIVYKLDDTKNAGVDISPVVNPTEWFSHVTGTLKSKNGKSKKTVTWKNPFYTGIMRPHEFEIGESDEGELQTAVDTVAARMFASVFQLQVILPTWLDKNGNVIKSGSMIEVKSPSNYVESYQKMLIASRTLQGTGESKTSILNCVIPGTYAGQIPGVIPWK